MRKIVVKEGDFDAIETFIGARIRQPLKINNDE